MEIEIIRLSIPMELKDLFVRITANLLSILIYYLDNAINTKIRTKSLKNDNEFEDITSNYITPKRM